MSRNRDAGGDAGTTQTPPAGTGVTPGTTTRPAPAAGGGTPPPGAGVTPGTATTGGTGTGGATTPESGDTTERSVPGTAAEGEVREAEVRGGRALHRTGPQLPTRAGALPGNVYAEDHPFALQAARERRAYLGLAEDGTAAEDPDKLPISPSGETVGERRERLTLGTTTTTPAGGPTGEGTAPGGQPAGAVLSPPEPRTATAEEAALNVVETLPHGVTVQPGVAVIPQVAEGARVGAPADVREQQEAGRGAAGGLPVNTQLTADPAAGTAQIVAREETRAGTPEAARADVAAERATQATRTATEATPLQRVAVPQGPAAEPGGPAQGQQQTQTPPPGGTQQQGDGTT